ncbi:VOC family protein [Nocardia alni]|uniref:VOC family protein n=1 Tax=Nocardia alni TaxID=2815723 RepID=UPI001C24230E|nr:VOC family protein [Nocardia alni]
MTETTSAATAATTTSGVAVWPCLVYRDAVAAIEFLERAFGFVLRARYPENGPVVDHAEMDWPGGGGIMFGSVREEMALDTMAPGTGSVYLVTDIPDELYRRAKEAGATITRELRDEDYGSRGFVCRDPEGVHWSFGTYAGA